MPKTTTTYTFTGIKPEMLQLTAGTQLLKQIMPTENTTLEISLSVTEVTGDDK